MTDRRAKSLTTLVEQVNALSPNRDKSSDGWIGDASHQTRTSDHNPYIHDEDGTWVVTAQDITNDPTHGVPSQGLADRLVASRDERIKYVISNKKICSGTGQSNPAWVWRPYTGSNPHDHHVHISVKSDNAHYDDPRPWVLNMTVEPQVVAAPRMHPAHQVLRRGSHGGDVSELQNMLNADGKVLNIDGDFGPRTEEAVRSFQYKNKLTADGVVGPYTWKALET